MNRYAFQRTEQQSEQTTYITHATLRGVIIGDIRPLRYMSGISCRHVAKRGQSPTC